MKIDVIRKLPEVLDTIFVLHHEDGDISKVEFLPGKIVSMLTRVLNAESFTFKAGEIKSIYYSDPETHSRIFLIGVGKPEKLSASSLRTTFANAIRQALKQKSKTIYVFTGFDVPLTDVIYGHVISEAALMASYKFDRYLPQENKHHIECVHLVIDTKNTRHINRGILEGRLYTEANFIARNLVNEPANVLNPEYLAEQAKKTALHYGLSIEVHALDKIRRLKMEAFLAVARGSVHEPRLIVMRYNGTNDHKSPVIGLIGKGLTYDSGGYCIKTPQGMLTMKDDMSGAAAVIGVMSAIANLKLKVNVTAVIAACENMISGEAYRPGDIIRAMNGKTIEVINTDAEGRLTLIDAINYAIEKENIAKIIDIATLTGAAAAAVGPDYSVLISNDKAWSKQLIEAGEATGELVWQLPARDEYKEMLKSEIADLKNTGGPWGGAITAGLFIREFVENKPWMHIDIAGSAYREKEGGIYSFGATGVGVRMLIQLFRCMED